MCVCVCVRGRGCEGVGNLGVILVRICEPELRNLPHSYSWSLIKGTHSCHRSPIRLSLDKKKQKKKKKKKQIHEDGQKS